MAVQFPGSSGNYFRLASALSTNGCSYFGKIRLPSVPSGDVIPAAIHTSATSALINKGGSYWDSAQQHALILQPGSGVYNVNEMAFWDSPSSAFKSGISPGTWLAFAIIGYEANGRTAVKFAVKPEGGSYASRVRNDSYFSGAGFDTFTNAVLTLGGGTGGSNPPAMLTKDVILYSAAITDDGDIEAQMDAVAALYASPYFVTSMRGYASAALAAAKESGSAAPTTWAVNGGGITVDNGYDGSSGGGTVPNLTGGGVLSRFDSLPAASTPLSVTVGTVTSGSIALSWTPPAPAAGIVSPARVVMLGDSLTAGSPSNAPPFYSSADRLEELLVAGGYSPTFVGLSNSDEGAGPPVAAQGGWKISNLTSAISSIAALTPNTSFINIGTNDCVNYVPDIGTQMTSFLNGYASALADPDHLYLVMVPINPGWFNAQSYSLLRNAISAWCALAPTFRVFVDGNLIGMSGSDYNGDGTHWSLQGRNKVAAYQYAVMQTALAAPASGALEYVIYGRKVDTEADWEPYQTVTGQGTNNAIVSNLEPDTEYGFKVAAVNATGESARSDEVTATTKILRVRCRTKPSAAGLSGVKAVIWASPDVGGVVGEKVGEATGLTFETPAIIDTDGKEVAILYVPISQRQSQTSAPGGPQYPGFVAGDLLYGTVKTATKGTWIMDDCIVQEA